MYSECVLVQCDMHVLYIVERIMTYHNYTNTTVDTAAAAVNAGTCLEDSNTEDNVFSHIGEAVSQVSLAGQSYVAITISNMHAYRTKLPWTQ